MRFDPLAFVQTKKTGKAHVPSEIDSFVKGAVAGEIPDYQIAAWLMAVCYQGLTFKETLALTGSMAKSGKTYKWAGKGPPVVDKHSTGGVGDSVTLVVPPLVAAMGMRMGKHSGRGLGHTGGTIDKLESIPGFRTSLSEREFRRIVDRAGCAVCGQDKGMTPADGIFYSLRDVTATVNQESLIASSIMAKKLAGGAPYILLDVKVGSGAFMKDVESAKSLAALMVRLGKASGRTVKAILSAMDAPLSRAIGNALEVAEAIHVLKNEVPSGDPLRMLSIEIAARLGSMCGLGTPGKTGRLATMLLSNGSALDRFREMIELQSGNPGVIDDPEGILPGSGKVLKVRSPRDGYVKSCHADQIGELVRDLGGGRKSKGDRIDPSVGVVLNRRVGDKAARGDLLCEIHSNGAIADKIAIERAGRSFKLSRSKPDVVPLITA